MPRAWFWYVVSLIWATTSATYAATVLERHVTVDLQGGSGMRQHTRLKVRLDSADDVESWAVYPVRVNENRSLENLTAYGLRPGGTKIKVGRKDRDTLEYAGGSILRDSNRYHVLSFPGLEVGSQLIIDYVVFEDAYYPADWVLLRDRDPVESLRVEIRGGGSGWRWRLDGSGEGLEVTETADGVTVTGNRLPAIESEDFSPNFVAMAPVLRFAWGEDPSWSGVGAWYTEILSSLPRGSESVRQQARELTAGLEAPRDRLEALLAFLRRKVRYVAVEIGIGGFRPTPPAEVLDRKWGDCKDKALLLIDMLDEVGIEAFPVLINAGREVRTDEQFPSSSFNHLIVALPADAVAHGDDAPVSEGYLFVDPTQTRGSARWLQPADQGQHVLVVRDGGGTLVETAVRPRLERRGVRVRVTVSPRGDAKGKAAVELGGALATPWLEQLANAPKERTAEDALSLFGRLLPGARLDRIGWSSKEDDVPEVELVADLTYEGMIRGEGSRRSFQLAGLTSTPQPSSMADRSSPIILLPRHTETTWEITLPADGCLPKEQEQKVETAVGVFEFSVVRKAADSVTIRRSTEILRRWIGPELFPELKKLALAEHRSQRRRIRLQCDEPAVAEVRSPG